MKWTLFGPETYYFLVAVLFVCRAMLPRSRPRRDYLLALVVSALGIVVCLVSARVEGLLFYDSYQVDLFSQVFKTLLSMGLFLVICLCSELDGIDEEHQADFYLLLTTCTLAMMLLVSSVHLLTIYVALELSSYSLYILVALRREQAMAIEASIKYFLVGVIASAVMLFGLALLYGTTGAAHVSDMIRDLPQVIDQPLVIVGLALTLGGFLFKLAVFPFHFWAPDVYQGAANQTAAYIATASKVAAIAILTRVVSAGAENSTYLVHVLVTLSIVSMTLGNLAAIVQKDLKRLLAYSSIAQAGYILIGILSMNPDGYAAAIFYALALLLMKFTSFLVVVKAADDGRNIQVDQLAGLHRRSPILALALMLSVFGLAGIPPTIGFTGKLLIFTAAMERGYFSLVLIAMINVVISLYYYILIVRAAYFLEPDQDLPSLPVSPAVKLLTGTLVAAMVVIGIFPRYVIDIAVAAARTLL